MECHSQSPDVNPLESQWRELKLQVAKSESRKLKALENFCKEKWAKIPPEMCVKLVINFCLTYLKLNFHTNWRLFFFFLSEQAHIFSRGSNNYFSHCTNNKCF